MQAWLGNTKAYCFTYKYILIMYISEYALLILIRNYNVAEITLFHSRLSPNEIYLKFNLISI